MKNMFMSAASDIQRTLKAFMAVGDNARKWLDVEGMLALEELDPNKDTKESSAWQVQAEATHLKKSGARIVKQEVTSSGRPARGKKNKKAPPSPDNKTLVTAAKVKKMKPEPKQVKVREVKVKAEPDLLHKLIQKAASDKMNSEESIALNAVLLSRITATPNDSEKSAPPQQKQKVGKAALISDALPDPKIAELSTKLDKSLKHSEGLDSKVGDLQAHLLESREEVKKLKNMLSQMAKEKDEALAALSTVSVERAKLEGQHTVLRELLNATKQSASDATGLLFEQLRSNKASPQKKKKKRVRSPAGGAGTPNSQ